MNAKTLGYTLAGARTLFGVGFLAAPQDTIKGWIGKRSARTEGAQLLTRAVGARDLAMGLGAIAALASGNGSARAWLAASALTDVCDAAATAAARRLPERTRNGVVALAAASALANLAVSVRAGARPGAGAV